MKDLAQLAFMHGCRFTAFLRDFAEGGFDGEIFLPLLGGAGGLTLVALCMGPGSRLFEAERAASEASTSSLSSNTECAGILSWKLSHTVCFEGNAIAGYRSKSS